MRQSPTGNWVLNRNSRKWGRRLLLLVLLGSSPAAWADFFSPSHSCARPHKPYRFTDQWEVDRFNNDVQRYKRCIQAFVEEQKRAAQVHRQAADEAVDEWNRYVRSN